MEDLLDAVKFILLLIIGSVSVCAIAFMAIGGLIWMYYYIIINYWHIVIPIGILTSVVSVARHNYLVRNESYRDYCKRKRL